jgi:Transglycosylase-like domain
VWPWVIAGVGIAVFALNRRPSQPDDVQRALATIRTMESGGNYTAKNPSSSASGAYQFLDTTWGGYGGYPRAWMAPPAVQDQKAAELVAMIQKRFGADPKWIPASWYVGLNGAATLDWNTVVPGNKSSVAQYVSKWLATYQRLA